MEERPLRDLPFDHGINGLQRQYGALPDCGLEIRRFLTEIFPDRWSTRDGPIPITATFLRCCTFGFFFVGLCYGYGLPIQSPRHY